MIKTDVVLGEGVVIPQPDLANLYGCVIGQKTKIGAFVEIQKGAVAGCNAKISSHLWVVFRTELRGAFTNGWRTAQ